MLSCAKEGNKSNTYKIFTKIIQNRIENKLGEQQPIKQIGFQKNYSLLDYVYTDKFLKNTMSIN